MSAVSTGPEPTSAHLRTIDRARLDGQLSPAARAWRIDVVEQTTSTNADLLDALRNERTPPAATQGHKGLANARVKVAYEQTAGRGRRGRSWVAQPGEALLFSVGGWLPRGIDGLGGLSLAVGLAVHDALRELPVDAGRVALKWPNDVLVDGAKVSGILIETATGTREATALVVGIGINLRGAATIARSIEQARSASEAGTTSAHAAMTTSNEETSASLATSAAAATPVARMAVPSPTKATAATPVASPLTPPPTPPTALDAIWAEPSMTDLLGRLLNRLAETFDAFGAEGFAPLRAAWCEADSYRDLPVALYEGGPIPTSGIARGVDDSGHLLIDTPTGLRTVASGDVSLRAA